MSSVAAGMERDAAEGAAVAHVPGMDDRITFSFFFSSGPGEKTTQSAEIGEQTEHPRPLVALSFQNGPSGAAASSKLHVSLKHL